jgi:hypothetical protein
VAALLGSFAVYGLAAHGTAHAYITNIYGNDVAGLDIRQRRVVARVYRSARRRSGSDSPPPPSGNSGRLVLTCQAPMVGAHGEGHEDGGH